MTTTQQPTRAPSIDGPSDLQACDPRCGRFVLDEHGVIVRCDKASEIMFGAAERVLVGRHISTLVPRLAAKCTWGGWLSPDILFLSHCEIPFRTRRFDGSPFISALHFFQFTEHNHQRVAVQVHDISTQGRVGAGSSRGWDSAWCLE